MNKIFNPSPSLNWEPLDIEEVYSLTGIKLKNKEWKWYFTNFHDFVDKQHTKECRDKHLYSGYASCDCKISSCMMAMFKAGTIGVSVTIRSNELFVNVPVEKLEDRTLLIDKDKRPIAIQERLYQGYETLITLLKVYEVTGLVLDFGPPLRLYTEDSYKKRKYVREISGDELFEMIHEQEDEEIKELKECHTLMLQS